MFQNPALWLLVANLDTVPADENQLLDAPRQRARDARTERVINDIMQGIIAAASAALSRSRIETPGIDRMAYTDPPHPAPRIGGRS